MRLRNTILFVLLAGILSSCIKSHGADLQVGDSIPSFSITLNDGSRMSSKDLRGGVSVLTFFHTGCGDCVAELPVMQQFYNDYGSQVKIVCISRAQGDDVLSKYWADNGFNMPYSAQDDASLYYKFAKNTIPRVYVVDRSLVIRAIFTDDPVASYAQLAEAVAACK